eukprot:TRINITY_DN57149_c0_g1_i1.p1 TRINITY_DN57149_c0_g1~~TRINITY_DN57149_c0_g1_i1.p1  ORF type:complete len:141 (+),score=36.12 TRINITY_DN57149_c0_g1_i1:59-424(+)
MFGKFGLIVFLFALMRTIVVDGYRKREENAAEIEAATEASVAKEAAKEVNSTKVNSTKVNSTQKSVLVPLEAAEEESKLEKKEETEEKEGKNNSETKSYATVRTTSLFVMSVGLSSVALNV